MNDKKELLKSFTDNLGILIEFLQDNHTQLKHFYKSLPEKTKKQEELKLMIRDISTDYHELSEKTLLFWKTLHCLANLDKDHPMYHPASNDLYLEIKACDILFMAEYLYMTTMMVYDLFKDENKKLDELIETNKELKKICFNCVVNFTKIRASFMLAKVTMNESSH